jgi:predicted transcriptional regulator
LHDRYGGLKVVLPSANGVFSSIRRVVIAEMLRRSLPVNRIAKQLGLSDRYIRATKTARGLT